MKLRIKYVTAPGQAHRVEVPNSASIQDVIDAILPETRERGNLLLSLNRKDPLSHDSSTPLLSCSVRSGDTIWVLNAPPQDVQMHDAPQRAAGPMAQLPAASTGAAQLAQDTNSAPPVVEVNETPHLPPHKRHAPDSDPGTAPARQNIAGPSTSGAANQDLRADTPPAVSAEADMDMQDAEDVHEDESLSLPQHIAWFPRTLSRLLDAMFGTAVQEGRISDIPPAHVLRLCVHACMVESGLELHSDQAVDAMGLPTSINDSAAVTQIKYKVSGHHDLPPCNIKFVGLSGYMILYCYVAETKTVFQACTIKVGDHIIMPAASQAPDSNALPAPKGGDQTAPQTSQRVASSQSEAAGMTELAPADCDMATVDACGGGDSDRIGANNDGVGVSGNQSRAADSAVGVSGNQSGAGDDGDGAGGAGSRAHYCDGGVSREDGGAAGGSMQPGYNWAQLFVKFEVLWATLNDRVVGWLLAQSFLAGGQEPPMGMNQLPQELKMMVLSHLEAKDLASLSECSNQWRHLSSVDALWQPLFMKCFKLARSDDMKFANTRGWKDCYIRRVRMQKEARNRQAGFRPVVPMFRQPPPLGFYRGGVSTGVVGGDYDRFPLPFLGGGPGMYRQPGPLGLGGMPTPGLGLGSRGFGAPGFGVPGLGFRGDPVGPGMFAPPGGQGRGRGRGRGYFMQPH